MEAINAAMSENLRRLREERKISLDELAALTGVSKSLLGKIERGDANPTISTVWKIAEGLRVSFTALMTRPEADMEVVGKADVTPFVEDSGRFRNYPLFPFDSSRRFELYYIEIDAGICREAEAHPDGIQEFVTVMSGRCSVTVDGESVTVNEGCTIRFKADRPHSYRNTGSRMCRISMIITYPEA